jgi:hypothetical protein
MTTPKVKKVSVTLAKPHTHAGEPKQPGDKINVTPDQRTWLIERGIVADPSERGDQ